MVKIADVINASFDILKSTVPRPRVEAELLVAHTLKKDRIYITVHKEDLIDHQKSEEIIHNSKLRAKGMPFAYITGKKEFMSLEFCVNSNVLIPRPETEELVSLIIDICKNKDIKILDLCSGSGAIALSCAYYLPKAVCHGADISPDAIEIANQNALNLGVTERTKFLKHDVLSQCWEGGLYDIVVSNPPYIESDIVDTLDDTVKSFEPRLALDGGTDGLKFYRSIIENINMYLKKGGIILFEIGYNQAKALKELMENKFEDFKVIKDYSGKERIVYGILK